MHMDKNVLYYLYVNWTEGTEYAHVKLKWNETGSIAAVQSQHFTYPQAVALGDSKTFCAFRT